MSVLNPASVSPLHEQYCDAVKDTPSKVNALAVARAHEVIRGVVAGAVLVVLLRKV